MLVGHYDDRNDDRDDHGYQLHLRASSDHLLLAPHDLRKSLWIVDRYVGIAHLNVQTTKITGLSDLDSIFSLLLYMPSSPLDRFVVVVLSASKSFTIVHAHPSQFITTSELILEDFLKD